MNNTSIKHKLAFHQLNPLLKLAIPLALTGCVQSANFFFETLFLAHLGKNYLAAGALGSWLFASLVVVLFGILSAINILISHHFGAKDHAKIADVTRDGLWFAVLFSLIAFALLWFSPLAFSWFRQSPSIIALATAYIHPLAFAVIASLVMMALMEVLMGIGRGNTIMIFTSLAVGLNIFFSYVLIFGTWHFPKLGIAGAGWGMTIAYFISCAILFFYMWLHNQLKPYFSKVFDFSSPSYFIELIKLGLPMGLMYSSEVAFFLVLTIIAGAFSIDSQAANQIAMQYMTAFMTLMFAMAQAITVRMGHLIGEGHLSEAKPTAYLGVGLCGLSMLIVAIVYWLFPRFLIAIDIQNSQENSRLILESILILFICGFFQIFEGVRIALYGALRALKDTHYPLWISIFGYWLIALPLGAFWAFHFHFGIQGLWWGMTIGAAANMLILLLRLHKKTLTDILNKNAKP